MIDRYSCPAPKFMLLNLGLTTRAIYGGPYYDKPAGMVGVKLAPEVHADAEHELAIRDFSIPPHKTSVDVLLHNVLYLLAVQKPVYVGCFGGKGRTGLFLALLAKAAGVVNPINYVREWYNPHAVENMLQERYIDNYVVPFSSWQMGKLKLWALLHGIDPRV